MCLKETRIFWEATLGDFRGMTPVMPPLLGLFCFLLQSVLRKYWPKQECIPVGCVTAVHLPYARVCFPGGGCVPGPGGCNWSRGRGCTWSGRGVCTWSGGIPGPGGCTWSGTPPWTEWHTLMKILPCSKLRLRAVIIFQNFKLPLKHGFVTGKLLG